MNKIAQYLNAHMLGEIIVSPKVRHAFINDGSIFQYTPDMIAYPRSTSDIRKIARFSWQLAEKGHALPLVTRGAGTNTTGAAIGNGMIVTPSVHMNTIFEYDNGQKLVRLQPGVTVNALTNALALYGAGIPELKWDHPMATIGGAIAMQRSALAYVDQLEVVLANGDVIQTKRLSKRELEKKKGQQTLEGEIYRVVDGLIEDNPTILDGLVPNDDRLDHMGYAGLEMVKDKHGNFDLTPLFVGSQGTLGIISEMILKPDFTNQYPAGVVAAFSSKAAALDALDIIDGCDPTSVEYLDATYFESAIASGKSFKFYDEASEQLGDISVVILVTINDFSERVRKKKVKKMLSKLRQIDAAHVIAEDNMMQSDVRTITSVPIWHLNPDKQDQSAPPVLDGMFIPTARFDSFQAQLDELAAKHHVTLPLYGRPLEEIWYVRPVVRMSTTNDKQKIVKLISDLAQLVGEHDGTAFGTGGEGRLSSLVAGDDQQAELFMKLRAVFDPHGTLNPGVKQPIQLRELVKQLRNTYEAQSSTSHLVQY